MTVTTIPTTGGSDQRWRLPGASRVAETGRAAAYLVVSVPLGLLWLLVVLAGLLLGGLTAVTGVGIVVLLATLAGAPARGARERGRVHA